MILGVDPGEKRVGLALADPETRFARPLEVTDAETAQDRIRQVVEEMEVTKVVVGRPVTLAGSDGPASERLMGFLDRLRSALSVEVDVYDERLTTVIAERAMREAGTSARRRKELRDAVAAQVMLQGYLDQSG